MYIPRLFQESDREHILHFIKENSFATLITLVEGSPLATHIPLLLKEKGNNLFLLGHIAKPNPAGASFDAESEVLAIFHGPHAYISSSWYDHVNVPTWNYQAVHIYGKARKLTIEESADTVLELVHKYEKGIENGLDWAELPAEVKGSLNGIISFEIEIEKIEAKSKLSQNRKDLDYFHIIEQLNKSVDPLSHAVASEMEKRRPKDS